MRRRTASTSSSRRTDEAGRSNQQPPARRRDWDPDKRRAAWELDRSAPGWAVFYGPYSRRFYAIAAWPSPCPLVLDAEDTVELRTLMHEADAAYGLRMA